MRILGIDPGLKATGYGVVELSDGRANVIEAGVIRTRDKRPLAERLHQIYKALRQVIEEQDPDEVVVESLYSHYRHPRTAILMGHARGVAYSVAAEKGLEVKSYSATRIKNSLVGTGRATKSQVQRCIGGELGLKEIPGPPDVADALAVALCHINVILHEKDSAQRLVSSRRRKGNSASERRSQKA
jgi:crossover junction endodeoxyribonuclease RuvC